MRKNERPLDFILIRQKDNILSIVNQMQATDSLASIRRDCDRIADYLIILSELWMEADYGYKLTEIAQRMVVLMTEAYYNSDNHKRRSGIFDQRMRFIKLHDSWHREMTSRKLMAG